AQLAWAGQGGGGGWIAYRFSTRRTTEDHKGPRRPDLAGISGLTNRVPGRTAAVQWIVGAGPPGFVRTAGMKDGLPGFVVQEPENQPVFWAILKK
ncbi:hypothetical protein, partial [Rhodopila globiformis]|uniref:hypothetical protein n=1 Tax=Rhodopila globiformis TaxID=1071 RepID=UPI0019560892